MKNFQRLRSPAFVLLILCLSSALKALEGNYEDKAKQILETTGVWV